MPTSTLKEIRDALEKAPLGSATRILTPGEAAVRASMVVEDMHSIGFNLKVEPVLMGPVGMPCYEICGSDFGQDEVESSAQVYKAGGTGLNQGSLLRLSKACRIGRALLPGIWPQRFKRTLADPKQHLSTVEELLWLGLWRTPTEIEPAAKPFAECEKDIDWRFRSSGQRINLEVKYRPKDWVRHADGPQNSKMFESYFEDIGPKFGGRLPGELNLAAITTPAAVQEDWRACALAYLQKTVNLDGILVWSLSPGEGAASFEIFSEQRGFIRLFFTEGDDEDRSSFGLVRYPMRDPENRRALTTPEAIAKLREEAMANPNPHG